MNEPGKKSRGGNHKSAEYVIADNARWERIFATRIDPFYYQRDERSPIQSTLSTCGIVRAPRGGRLGAE